LTRVACAVRLDSARRGRPIEAPCQHQVEADQEKFTSNPHPEASAQKTGNLMSAMTLGLAILAATLLIDPMSAGPVVAGPWPQRTVRVITPFSPGTDNASRAFAEPLARRWKQPVVIEKIAPEPTE
jgi:hypothetical protein